MAEAVGLASGLLTLSSFTLNASISLYSTVKEFRSHPKAVRDLLDELQALAEVLGSLNNTANELTDVDLSILDFPLLRCGTACKEFEQEVQKCLPQPDNDKPSFRAWARLRYMGSDISGFRELLSGYKLTISVALADVHLRKTSATAETLRAHEDLINTAKADLGAHLDNLDEKMELILNKITPGPGLDASELQRLKQERLSTEKCLEICTQLSNHIAEVEMEQKDNGSSATDSPSTFSEKVVNEGLSEWKNSIGTTATKLESYMNEILDQLLAKSKTRMSEKEVEELARLKDQWETTRQCLDICSTADKNIKENISTIVNHSTGDAVQFMVSTDGSIINGTNRGLGWRSRQVGGHLSDASVQEISKNFASINIQRPGEEASRFSSNIPSNTGNDRQSQPTSEFSERHGRGQRLSPKPGLEASSNISILGARGNHEG